MTFLTIIIGRDGYIYNLAKGETPARTDVLPKDAFTCSEEDYIKLMKKHGQEIFE